MTSSDPPFHELIEAARLRAGLSFEALSHRAWTTPSFSYRICTGRAKPGRDIVIRLGVALNLDVETIDLLLRSAGHLGLIEPHLGLAEPAETAPRSTRGPAPRSRIDHRPTEAQGRPSGIRKGPDAQ